MGRTKQQATSTRKKKNVKPPPPSANDLEPPDAEGWAKLEIFEVLELMAAPKSKASATECKPGDCVAVFPGSGKDRRRLNIHDYWIARVKEIRGTRDGMVCWVKVHWYYKPADARKYLEKNGKSTAGCAKMECLASIHTEIIAGPSISHRIRIHKFREDDPNQPPIPNDAFFTRFFFSTHWGNSMFNVIPYKRYGSENVRSKQAHFVCSICSRPYAPDEEDGVQHWCPAPKCRRGWHRKCLLGQNDINGGTTTHQLIHGRLSNVDSTTPNGDSEPRPRLPPTDKLKGLIPSQLLLLAAQPIVRGGAHGVAGNVAIVLRARRLVHTALQANDSSAELDRWLLDPEFEKWEDAIVENLGLGDDATGNGFLDEDAELVEALRSLALKCPKCGGSI